MHIKEKSEKEAFFPSIYTRREKRGSPNSKLRKNEVACNGGEIKMEPRTVEMFDLLSSDDDKNKKPYANKNTNFIVGMTKNTGDNEEYEHKDELEQDNKEKDDNVVGSDEEEEDEEEDEEKKKMKG